MGKPSEILVVGAGLVGSLLAVYLRRRDLAVEVRERRADPRQATKDEGRSINLVVTSRGIAGLKRVGLWEPVKALSVAVRGRRMHAIDGTETFQPYGRDESEVNYSVSRGDLNRFLVDTAEREGAHFLFSSRLAGKRDGLWRFDTPHGDAFSSASVVMGTDGANSQLRAEMIRAGSCDATVETLDYGYKELVIPAGPAGSYRLEATSLHIWPRGNFMMMALPNRDGSFTVTLYLPNEGKDSFATLAAPGAATKFFQAQFPDALPLLEDVEGTMTKHPVGSLATVRCDQWHRGGDMMLFGDAAHGIVPFFGQGMNSGFEDLLFLDEAMERWGSDWGAVFPEVFAKRKPNTDAIADMALQNFVEMRDKVGDAGFLLRKKVEGGLEKRFPSKYRTRYALVAYSLVPYVDALEAGKIQEGLLEELCRGVMSPEAVDWTRAERLIDERLVPFWKSRGIHWD